jgi:hypothetical protein
MGLVADPSGYYGPSALYDYSPYDPLAIITGQGGVDVQMESGIQSLPSGVPIGGALDFILRNSVASSTSSEPAADQGGITVTHPDGVLTYGIEVNAPAPFPWIWLILGILGLLILSGDKK